MSDQAIEILVHITAPSRVSDDSRYRQLARAYLDFEPSAAFPVTSSDATSETHQGGHGSFSGIESPNLSFRSAFGNATSPRLRQPAAPTQESDSFWVAPPSVVQDSLPDNHTTFAEFRSPTRILEHYISAFDSSQSELPSTLRSRMQLDRSPGLQRSQFSVFPYEHIRSGQRSPLADIPNEDSKIPIERTYTTSGATQTSGNDITSSQPLTEPSTSSPAHRQHSQLRPPSSPPQPGVIPLSPENNRRLTKQPTAESSAIPSFIFETRILSSFPAEIPLPSSRADSEPPAKRPCLSPRLLARSTSDVLPRNNPPQPLHLRPSLAHLTILAPSPPPSLSTLTPTDMLTPTLLDLAEKVNLQSRYRPQTQTRELRHFERGYWLVDCSSWEGELKEGAWEFLTNYLRNGLIGWGVMCKRDEEFSWMRLYCWGCVVEYMYLVVWVASKRKVRFTGARWVGADGEAVVVVGARPPSR